jgi:hypothetical protein
MAATASLSFLPLFPFAFPRRWSTVPHRAGARDGTAAPARRSARRGQVRERGADSTAGEVKDPTTLSTEHLRRTRAPVSSATCPARRTARGTGGIYTSGCLLPRFKRTPGRRGTDAKPPTPPLGVFHSQPPLLAPAWEKEEARRHRVAPGKGGAGSRTGAGTTTPPGAPSTRQRHRLQPPPVGRREGRLRRRREPDRSKDPYTAGNAYFATPPPFSTRLRLHRRPNVSTTADAFSLSSLLELCSV